jgi:hypothetical protein
MEIGDAVGETDSAYWSRPVSHPQWGRGVIVRLKNMEPPPDAMLDFSTGLTLRERSHLLGNMDIIRAITNFIMDGEIKRSTRGVAVCDPKQAISMVPADAFNNAVGEKEAHRLRPDHQDDHDTDRSVACDIKGGWFAKNRVNPCKWLTAEDFGQMVILFSATPRSSVEIRQFLEAIEDSKKDEPTDT